LYIQRGVVDVNLIIIACYCLLPLQIIDMDQVIIIPLMLNFVVIVNISTNESDSTIKAKIPKHEYVIEV